MELWHGSTHVVKHPLFGYGKMNNDYGRGFYCTEHKELAKEWSCVNGRSGFANHYELDLEVLHILNLNSNQYSVLNWLAILVTNRQFTPQTAIEAEGIRFLKKYFIPDITDADVIIGYRADDSYFSFARAFVGNAISLKQLSRAMRLGELGEQVVLISAKAFDQIQFLEAIPADVTEYYPKRKERDESARARYRLEAMSMDLNGLYMKDIIREKVKNDDPRLQ